MSKEIKIDKIQQEKIKNTLDTAFIIAQKQDFQVNISKIQQEQIKSVILGSHKTYRYVLITELVTKATIPEINALALQTKSSLDGAYDARSVAHMVVVPFERHYLANALGGSNEPFLNKPARFPELSMSNAVRSGNDKKELETLITLLSQIDQKQAFGGLQYALHLLIDKKEKDEELLNQQIQTKTTSNTLELRKIFNTILSKTDGGQSLPLTIGIALNLLLAELNANNISIDVHKVNESGASSKEVGDIDISRGKQLIATIEAKDKKFDIKDVEHAAKKTVDAGLDSFFFVFHNQVLNSSKRKQIIHACQALGCYVSLIDINDFLNFVLCFVHSNNIQATYNIAKTIMQKAAMTQSVEKRVNKIFQSKATDE